MTHSKEGIERRKRTILEKYGPDFYKRVGKQGGRPPKVKAKGLTG